MQPDSTMWLGIVRWAIKTVVGDLLIALALFGAAGRLDWRGAWIYLGLVLVGQMINAAVLIPTSPDLIAERAALQKGTKPWDVPLAVLVAYHPLCVGIAAGLDLRFGWSPPLPPALPWIAAVVALCGSLLTTWAMVSNRFFAGTVRIQTERGHAVATGGPYRTVRHPGYVGVLIFALAAPLILNSLWALAPVAFTVAVTVLRTAREDRMLQAELPGYLDYANRVRHRLLPGVW